VWEIWQHSDNRSSAVQLRREEGHTLRGDKEGRGKVTLAVHHLRST